MSHIIFSDLKRKKDLNQLVLSKTQRKTIHQNVKILSSTPGKGTKAQADTSSTLQNQSHQPHLAKEKRGQVQKVT